MARWNLTILVVTAIVIAGLVAYGLRTSSPLQTAPAFTVTRQQAVIAVLESSASGLPILPVSIEKYPRGVDGKGAPEWVVSVDLFYSPLLNEGPWERRGCVVDGRTAIVKACQGGKLPYVPAD